MSVGRDSEATKKRILDAAAMLFAERGFSDVSLRDITAQGLANVAAVNYHFGTKEALWEEVVGRVVGPLMEMRRARLDALHSGEGVEELVAIWLDPIGEVMNAVELDGARVCRLIGRWMDGEVEMPGKLDESGLVRRWIGSFEEAVEDQDQLEWRVGFMRGAIRSALMGDYRKEEWSGALDRLKRFCVGGLRVGEVSEQLEVADVGVTAHVASEAGSDVDGVVEEENGKKSLAEEDGDSERGEAEVVTAGESEGGDGEDEVVEGAVLEVGESPFVRTDLGGKAEMVTEGNGAISDDSDGEGEDLIAEADSDVEDDGVQNEFLF